MSCTSLQPSAVGKLFSWCGFPARSKNRAENCPKSHPPGKNCPCHSSFWERGRKTPDFHPLPSLCPTSDVQQLLPPLPCPLWSPSGCSDPGFCSKNIQQHLPSSPAPTGTRPTPALPHQPPLGTGGRARAITGHCPGLQLCPALCQEVVALPEVTQLRGMPWS